MDGQGMPRKGVVVPPVLWKMITSASCGGAIYLVTALTHQPAEWGLMLSAFVGGIALVVQFFIDFDADLQSIDTRIASHKGEIDDIVRHAFRKINDATTAYSTIEASPVGTNISQFVQEAAMLDGSLPKAALRLAGAEIGRVASFLHGLGDGQATYAGEDQDWLLTLTREADQTIDATSTTAVDGGASSFADGFWSTSLGHRYLAAQRDAANRGITIRRLFILNSRSPAEPAKRSGQRKSGQPED